MGRLQLCMGFLATWSRDQRELLGRRHSVNGKSPLRSDRNIEG